MVGGKEYKNEGEVDYLRKERGEEGGRLHCPCVWDERKGKDQNSHFCLVGGSSGRKEKILTISLQKKISPICGNWKLDRIEDLKSIV